MRIFYLLFTIYGLSHVYVFICLRRAFGGGMWQIPALFWLSVMALSWLWRFGRSSGPLWEKFHDVSSFWMGFLILLCYCLIAADLLALFSRLSAVIFRAEVLKSAAAFMVASRYVPAALVLALVLYGYALYEAQTPRIRHLTVASSKIPAGEALRVVGAADIHISSIIGPLMLRRMADKIAEQRPDILVLAGDLVDTDVSNRAEDAAILRAIPARLGKFAVTGNHEFYRGPDQSDAFIRSCGFRLLQGEWQEVGGIVIAGVDDGNFAGLRPEGVDVMRTLVSASRDRFILLLNHQPWYPRETVGLFDLQFSGHTHAGQFWPGGTATRSIYGAGQGLSTLSEGDRRSLLYITNGLGFWGPPIRFLAPPEITVLTLTHAEK